MVIFDSESIGDDRIHEKLNDIQSMTRIDHRRRISFGIDWQSFVLLGFAMNC